MDQRIRDRLSRKVLENADYGPLLEKAQCILEVEAILNDYCINMNIPMKEVFSS